MKICPICKARCFDDMEVCFGCMHRFDEDEDVDEVRKKTAQETENQRNDSEETGSPASHEACVRIPLFETDVPYEMEFVIRRLEKA